MKKALLTIAFLIVAGTTINASAQIYNLLCRKIGYKEMPAPQKNWHHHSKIGAFVSYDAASTVLTVKFPPKGGTLTVTHNGTQVASMTAGSGTTFRSELRQYGTGNYTVIVSNGKTVMETKNYVVK